MDQMQRTSSLSARSLDPRSQAGLVRKAVAQTGRVGRTELREIETNVRVGGTQASARSHEQGVGIQTEGEGAHSQEREKGEGLRVLQRVA